MEFLKKNNTVIAVVVIILILVIIRSVSVNHFRSDAKRWAEPSVTRTNTVTSDQIRNLKGNVLTINLDDKMMFDEKITSGLRNIPADSILSKKIIKSILKHKGPVLIYSYQPALSARIWMVLSQMGCKEIYILTSETGNETPENKFPPDNK